MTNINIDTEKLLEEIDKLQEARDSMNELFEASVNENKILNEDWSSDTSKVVDEEFKRFDDAQKEYITKIDTLIEYLKDVVTDSYIDYETQENKLIDENIATN